MEKREFGCRLARLRTQKGVSARDMSLSLGQSAGYINNVENGVNYPSMAVFFYICDYLGITPQEFFQDEETVNLQLEALRQEGQRLSAGQLQHLLAFLQEIPSCERA